MSVKKQDSGPKPPVAPSSNPETQVRKPPAQPMQEGPAGAHVAPPVADDAFADTEGRKDALIGTKVDGRYKIEELLGSGGYGKVYLAKDERLFNNRVALKMLYPPGKDENPMEVLERLNRFEREAQVASSLNHPNIVRVTDFGRTQDKAPYCVMEFVEGGSLHDEIFSERAMPLRRFLSIMVQVCDALAAAHERGIIHRDLKPGNILLTKPNGSDVPKISDFGLVKVVAPNRGGESGKMQLTQVGSILGTPEYMSPEQITGRTMDDPSIDIYAIGVTMYQMLCKKVPFEDAFDRERRGEMQFFLVQKMVEKEVPKAPSEIRRDIPKEVSDVIMSCLEKDPQKRPASMKAMKSSLERCARRLQAAHTAKIVQPPAEARAAKQAGNDEPQGGLTIAIPPEAAPRNMKMVLGGVIASTLAVAGFAAIMLGGPRQSTGDRLPGTVYAADAGKAAVAEPQRAAEPKHPARKTFQLTFVTEPGGVEISADGETLCTSSGDGICSARVEEGAGREFEFRKDGHVAKSREIAPDADMVVKVRLERKRSERPAAKLVPPVAPLAPPRESPPAAKAAPKEDPRVKPAETRPEKHSPRITDEGDAPKKPRITDEGG